MVISRKEMAYQQVGTTSSKSSNLDIFQNSKLYFISHTKGQHSGFDILEKNGRNQESENDYTVKDVWEMLISEQIMITVEYLPILLNKVADLECRHKVDSSEWVLRRRLSQSLPEIRDPSSIFICFKGVTPSSTICCVKTRSLHHSHGRNANSLDTGSLSSISAILSDP